MILSIETTSNACSVALSDYQKIYASYNIFENQMHDKMLAELTKRILEDFSIKVDDLSSVAVSAGPGSFTGLRIGAAFAKGLCYDNHPKLISVPTLHSFANAVKNIARISQSHKIQALIPSHKGLVYTQEFDDHINAQSEITLVEFESLNLNDKSILFAGNIEHNSPFIKINHSAELIAKFIIEQSEQITFVNADDFIPLYVQDFIPNNQAKAK